MQEQVTALKQKAPAGAAPPHSVLRRTLTGVGLIATFGTLLYLDHRFRNGVGIHLSGGLELEDALVKGGAIVALAGAVLVAWALYEYARVAAGLGVALSGPLLAAGGVVLFLLQWAGWLFRHGGLLIIPPWLRDPGLTALVALCGVSLAILAQRAVAGRIEKSAEAAGLAVLGLLYIAVTLGFLNAIRTSSWGLKGLMTCVAVCKVTDIGAYYAGTFLRGWQLAPVVSPNKTVAGAVGGTLAAALVGVVLSLLRGSILTPLQGLLYGLLAGPVCIVGDLAESVLKRQAAVKDTVVLDLVDGLLFGVPFSYFFFLAVQ